jgi:hypothetical protein
MMMSLLVVVVPALDEASSHIYRTRPTSTTTATEATPRGIQKTAITGSTRQRRREDANRRCTSITIEVHARFHAFLGFFVRLPFIVGTHFYSL